MAAATTSPTAAQLGLTQAKFTQLVQTALGAGGGTTYKAGQIVNGYKLNAAVAAELTKVANGNLINSGVTGAIAAPITDVTGAISSIWGTLTTPATWLRIAEFVGGAVLLFIAIKSLTGVQTPSVGKAAVAAAVA
jgi:hypothetical protein